MWIPDGCVPVLAVVSFLAIFSLGLTMGESCGALVTATEGENLNGLMSRAFSSFRRTCRKKKNIPEEKEATDCSFVTEATPASDLNFTFILKPLVMPFRLSFDVKAPSNIVVLLAWDLSINYIFAEICIGCGNNEGAFIRKCYSGNANCNTEENNKVAEISQAGLVSSVEFRTFWVSFGEGFLRVGKGNENEGFMFWHFVVSSTVHVGISTYGDMERGDWVFHAFCE